MFLLPIDEECKLVLLQNSHAEALFMLQERNRQHLEPWMPHIKTVTSVEDMRDFIKTGLPDLSL